MSQGVTQQEEAPAHDDPGHRLSSEQADRPWLEALGVAAAGALVFVLGFGGGLGRLSVPLGAGDLLPAYATAKLWSAGTPFGNNSLGYPYGMELRYYPTTDVFQNALAGFIAWISGNPFLGINAMYAASFPLTALAGWWVLRLVRVRGPVGVLLALALTVVPYHWYRIDHVYLGTMYSAVLGVGLAVLVGNGSVVRALRGPKPRQRALLLAGLAVVIAGSGIYYAFFAVLLGGGALVFRFAKRDRWRDLLISATAPLAVALLTAAALLPAFWYARQNPPAEGVADRHVIESVEYSGALAMTLLPAPVSEVPGLAAVNDAVEDIYSAALAYDTSGVIWYANFGSLATVLAGIVAVTGALVAVRRPGRVTGTAGPGTPADLDTLALSALLLALSLLFFVPWGLNFLFAYAVTPQLRGWDRLVPVLFTLTFICAGVGWRALRLPERGPRAWLAVAVVLGVVALDSVVPYRSHFAAAAANGSSFSAAGYAYAGALNAAIPERCAVLQLPYVAYPEEPPKVSLGNYEHFWPALTNSQKRWSFGAMKGTAGSRWQDHLGSDLDEPALAALRDLGFCAVHVDRRGFTEADAATLVSTLESLTGGGPVASGLGGSWVAFDIRAAGGSSALVVEPGADGADLIAEASPATRLFYEPPEVDQIAGSPAQLEHSPFDAWRWLGVGEARFEVTASSPTAGYSTVSGVVRAAECSAQTVSVRLASGAQGSVARVDVGAGASQAFTVALDDSVTASELAVTIEGVDCTTPEDARARAAALVDLEFGP